MIKKLLTLFLFSTSFMAISQTFEWVKTPEAEISVNPNNLGYSTVVDPSGNVYMGGFKDNHTIYTELFGNLFYHKYDADGVLLFSKTFSGKAVLNQMVTDSQGNILVAVAHLNTLTFGALSIENSDQSPQHVFFKLNPNGDLLWHKVLNIPVINVNTFQAIAVDATDHIYLGYDNYGDCYIEKLSPSGEELSLISQTGVNRLTSLSVDSEGNIYAVGSCANFNATYAGVLQPTDLSYTLYLVKYSSAGVFQWVKYVEDITCPAPMVKVSTLNEIYFSSSLFTDVALDDLTVQGPTSGGTDFFIAKVDSSGNYLWATEVPGNGSVDVGTKNYLNLDSEGNIYFAGLVSGGLINWGNGITTDTGSFSNREALVLKYNPDGQIQLAVTAGGELNDEFNSVTLGADGSIYATGLIRGSATFGSLSHTAANNFDYTPFLAKILDNTLAVPQNDLATLTVFPNPVKDKLTILAPQTVLNVTVYSLTGQRISLQRNENQLDFSGVANGVYVVEVETENGLKSIKVVK